MWGRKETMRKNIEKENKKKPIKIEKGHNTFAKRVPTAKESGDKSRHIKLRNAMPEGVGTQLAMQIEI